LTLNLHDQGRTNDTGDRRDIADEVEVKVEHGRIYRICCGSQQQRVAIRECPHDRLSCDIAGSATAVLDDK
jgi:hypothetical protein